MRRAVAYLLICLSLTLLFGTSGATVRAAPNSGNPLAAASFARSGALILNAGEGGLSSAVIDAANGFAYYGTDTYPGIVVKVRLSDFTRVGALTLNSGEDYLQSAVIDTLNGFAYFGTHTSPGIVVKVRLSNFTRVGALTLNPGEDLAVSAVIDTANGFAYFGTRTSPGIVVKVRLSDFMRFGALTFSTGENLLVSAVIDAGNGFAYFGTATSPGSMVKVKLSDLTRVGALTLNTEENNLSSAVIDTANGYAYFGTRTDPGMIVKVRLSDFTRVGTLWLNLGEGYLTSAVLDTSTPVNPIAYFGTNTLAAYVVKLRLYDMRRIGAVGFAAGETTLLSAVMDTANRFAYFGTHTDPGRVVRVQLSGEPLPELAASIRAAANPVSAGTPLTYTLVVSNSGALLASGVTLTATLPATVSVNLTDPSQGSCEGASVLVCALGTLIPGSRAEVTLIVTPLQAGTLNSSVNVRASQPELNTANNSASLTTSVNPAPPIGPRLYLPAIFRAGPSEPTATFTLPATITLSASATALAPTSTLGLQWQLGGDLTGTSLLLRAREPGNIYTSTVTYQPGALPPTGRVFYLQPGQTWTLTPTNYLALASAGNVNVTLPSTREGEWSIEALLRDSSANVVAAGTRMLLSTSVPRIVLNRSRAIANTNDRVFVELLSAAGGTTQDVKIVANLTLNDGTQVALPSFTPGSPFLYVGPAANIRFTLHDGPLAFYGEGNYLVQASLMLSSTGQLLGMAAVGVQVCNTPSTLTGVVSDGNGQPLGGNSPSLAVVSALDVDDGTTAATSALAGNGAYALTLEPGRYLISAVVEDAAGHHQTVAPNILSVGCAGGNLTLNLSASAALARARVATKSTALGIRPSEASAPAANASDRLPKPSVFIISQSKDLLPADFAPNTTPVSLTADFKAWLSTASGNQVDLLTTDEFRLLLQGAVNQLKVGNEVDIEALSAQNGRDFVLQLDFGRDALGTYVRGSLIDIKNAAVMRRYERRANPITSGMVLQLASQLGVGLFDELRAVQERPIVPIVSLALSTGSVTQGGVLNATLTLKDGNGTVVPGATVNILHWTVGRTTLYDPSIVGGVTDANGRFTAALLVGNTAGTATVDGQFVRRNLVWCVQSRACKGSRHYQVSPPSNLTLSAGVNELHAFESTQVCASVQRGGNWVSGASVNISAVGGYGVPSSVTTRSDGRACFGFTADATGAVASVYAQYTDPQNSTTSNAELPFYVIGSVDAVLNAFPTTVVNDNVSKLTVRVTVGNAAMASVPVQLSVDGGGVLSTTATQTDDNGQLSVNYLAPPSGTGIAYITATANVADLYVTRTTSIEYRPVACQAPAGATCYNATPITGLSPLRLTDNGKVLGWKYTMPGYVAHFMVWQNGALTDGGALSAPSGVQADSTNILDVNEAGQAVGTAVLNNCSGCSTAVRWLGSGGACPASETQPPDCAHTSVPHGSLLRINASGDVVGTSGVPYGTEGFLWPSSTSFSTVMTYTENNNAYHLGAAYGGNSNGQVAYVPSQGRDIAGKVARWQLVSVVRFFSQGQLTSLGGTISDTPADINSAGGIVGTSNGHAFYAPGNSMIDLGTLGGSDSGARALNSGGQVVGYSRTRNNETRAFVYTGGSMYDLNRLVDYMPGVVFDSAYAINTSGQILAMRGGVYNLLTPR